MRRLKAIHTATHLAKPIMAADDGQLAGADHADLLLVVLAAEAPEDEV